jgi:uncharacterized Fe-S center protein
MPAKSKPRTPSAAKPVVYFADAAVARLESSLTLPAKFKRLLEKFDLPARVKDKRVGIKMHFGGGIGFTTISPVFIRILVQALKDAGARHVKVMDNNPADGVARGYTREVLGCEVVSTFGASHKYLQREKIGFKLLDEALLGGEALDCDFFIDLSHVKGHGACGFGGALKNIAMGVTPPATRGKLHRLEGGIAYDTAKCTYCKKCLRACPNGAISANDKAKQVEFFFHHCTFCQHCILICPTRALKLANRSFEDFAEGMARVTAAFLKKFAPEQLLFINVLLTITMFCDCWGMSSPALVPDIGILASTDLVAADTASLDLIKTENLLLNGLPKGRELRDGAHLFEQVHGKDPYVMLRLLERLGGGRSEYVFKEIA